MDEELHPIELDDGNIAAEVQQVLAAAAADPQENDPPAQPSPEDVYNRIVQFEGILKDAWTEFQDTVTSELTEINEAIGSLQDDMREFKKYERRQVDFTVGDSVVLLEKRKVGRLTHVTQHYADVLLDGERNEKKTVRKKKTVLLRLHR